PAIDTLFVPPRRNRADGRRRRPGASGSGHSGGPQHRALDLAVNHRQGRRYHYGVDVFRADRRCPRPLASPLRGNRHRLASAGAAGRWPSAGRTCRSYCSGVGLGSDAWRGSFPRHGTAIPCPRPNSRHRHDAGRSGPTPFLRLLSQLRLPQALRDRRTHRRRGRAVIRPDRVAGLAAAGPSRSYRSVHAATAGIRRPPPIAANRPAQALQWIDRIIAGLVLLAVITTFTISSAMLTNWKIHYVTTGGGFYEKFHPAAYFSFLAFGLLLIRNNDPIGEINRILSDAKLVLVYLFCWFCLLSQQLV